MRKMICLLILSLGPMAAQTPVTTAPVREDSPQQVGGYTVSNSFETGYRFASVGGNRDVYRASVNYGNGIRLFQSEIRIDSIDGKGRLLDEFTLRTFGAATDPYQAHSIHAEKHRSYRYDMRVRRAEYFNQLPMLWNGERGMNSERLFQNHDLTLAPGSRLEVFLGFDRNKQSGPGFSSSAVINSEGALDNTNFLRYATDLRRVNNTYRAGFNLRAFGLALTALHSLDDYKEDTGYRDGSSLPSVTGNVQQLSALSRNEPFHGTTPVTSLALRTEKERRIGFQGRFVYAGGRRNSVLSEELTGTGAALSTVRQTYVFGDADRKQGTGEFTVTWMPSDKWTVTNTTAANNTRITGLADFLEVTSFSNQYLEFSDLGIRLISNATQANFRPIKQVGLYGAYRYSTRRVRVGEAVEFPGFRFAAPVEEVDNRVHIGAGGVRWLPTRSLRASFDVEVGRADQPLTPVSERKFHNETARLQWRKGMATLTAHFENKINNNPTALLDYSSASRGGGLHASWADPKGRVTLDGGYVFRHLDTSAGIFNLFDYESDSPAPARTYYTSNLHTGNFGGRFVPHERLTVYLGYVVSKDAGDGRDRSFAAGLTPSYPAFSFDGANFFTSFPLTYQSPQGRLTVKVHEQLSWNFGWQFYHYGERFTGIQNYRAHVGYSSLSWSF